MKYLAILLTSGVLLLLSIKPVQALYDPRTVENNKAGVHILDPSEIDSAARLVNSNGGDWGYLTIPIQPTDRANPSGKHAKSQRAPPDSIITSHHLRCGLLTDLVVYQWASSTGY